MWEFNRIYRNLEGALTDAAQFTELLLDPPAVTDADAADAVQAARLRRGAAGRCRSGTPSQPLLFDGFR